MSYPHQRAWTWIGAILVAIGLIGCNARSTSPQQASTRPAGSADAADSMLGQPYHIAGISLEVLNKADLQLDWASRLPLGRSKTINQFFYHNGRLFILTQDNLLSAVDPASGTILWTTTLGSAETPCTPPQYYGDNLLFLLGRSFVQVRQSDGQIVFQTEIRYPVSTLAARSEKTLFVGSTNQRFYALRSQDGIPVWQNLCPDMPFGNIVVTTDKVYFVTRDHHLFVSESTYRDLIWKFQAQDAVAGVVVDGGQCLLPSADTVLYCFDPETGAPLWEYLAGGSLIELPVLTADAIYQPVGHTSLVCLERQPQENQQRLRWELKNGYCLLAENGPVSYCMTHDNELTLMSNRTGKTVLSFFVPNLNLFARNNEDAKIFLASRSGTIVVLRPKQIAGKPAAAPAAEPATTETPAVAPDTAAPVSPPAPPANP
ncbi:MAG: PQQ-like beta-propeller repeat protein [Sedimentisphaerales bacterium]|nr:PQQ-like beta-propeller repeat protein [Sedimentisphaerales bacterium]